MKTITIKSIVLLASSFFFISTANAVLINGKDWRPIIETSNISYNQMASIYDVNTGILLDNNNTIIGQVNFSGYMWASIDDVRNMLSTYIAPVILDNINTTHQQVNSVWANTILTTFGANFNDLTLSGTRAITRTTVSTNPDHNVAVADIFNIFDIQFDDIIRTNQIQLAHVADPTYGQWLYTTVVPIPTAAYLMGTSLIGLLGFSRRKKLQLTA